MDRWRWPRRRTRVPGRGRIAELAQHPDEWFRRGAPARLRNLGRIDEGDRLIGMLMIRDEDDVLGDSLAAASRWFDRIYVLDGTTDQVRVERTDAILASVPEVAWHARDADWFPGGITDGARQILLERIRRDHGFDNWIGLLHADEFLDQDPRPMLAARHPSTHPSLRVRVAHTFLHVEDEHLWDDLGLPLRAKVAHQMWPGVPESRFFFDDGSRNFDIDHHSKVVPKSFRAGELIDGYVITQYNERGTHQVTARAQQRAASGWQVGHYSRLLDDEPEVFIDTLDLAGAPFAPEFAGDPEGPFSAESIYAVPLGPVAHVPAPVIETELTSPVVIARLQAEGRTVRDFRRVFQPGGIVDRLAGDTPASQARAIRALGEPGALGHDRPVAGSAALIRHTASILRSPRTPDALRAVAVAECLIRLGNAQSPAGWYAIVPANRRGAVSDLLAAA